MNHNSCSFESIRFYFVAVLPGPSLLIQATLLTPSATVQSVATPTPPTIVTIENSSSTLLTVNVFAYSMLSLLTVTLSL